MNTPIDLEPADDLAPEFSDSFRVSDNEFRNQAPEVAVPEVGSKSADEIKLLEYYFDNLMYFSK